MDFLSYGIYCFGLMLPYFIVLAAAFGIICWIADLITKRRRQK